MNAAASELSDMISMATMLDLYVSFFYPQCCSVRVMSDAISMVTMFNLKVMYFSSFYPEW